MKQALVIFLLLACLPLLSTGSRRSKFSLGFRRVYMLTTSLETVDSDTANQTKYLYKVKIECVGKDKTPIPRRGDAPPTPRRLPVAPRAVLTPLLRRKDAAPAPR